MQSSDVGRLESNGTSVLVPTQCTREEKNKQKTQLNKREQANQIYVLNFCAKIFLSHAGWQKLADFCAPPKIQQTFRRARGCKFSRQKCCICKFLQRLSLTHSFWTFFCKTNLYWLRELREHGSSVCRNRQEQLFVARISMRSLQKRESFRWDLYNSKKTLVEISTKGRSLSSRSLRKHEAVCRDLYESKKPFIKISTKARSISSRSRRKQKVLHWNLYESILKGA